MNIVTDWKVASRSEYKQFNWGSIQIIKPGENGFEEWYSDINWGYVQFGEYSTTSYKNTYWGQVEYGELKNTSYKKINWARIEAKEFGSDDYTDLNWGKLQYKEVFKSSTNLNDVNWGLVQTNEWGKDDLKILTKSSTDKKLEKLKTSIQHLIIPQNQVDQKKQLM